MIGDLPQSELHSLLRTGRLLFRRGPAVIRVDADHPDFAPAFQLFYSRFEHIPPDAEVADTTIQLRRASPGTFYWLVNGAPSGQRPVNRREFITQFEWELHWAVAPTLAPSLAFHAAVAADEHGRCVAALGAAGSGKSTLIAGLVGDGWRLVADEYLILDPEGRVVPMPAPITLKGDSVAVIQQRRGEFTFGPAGYYPEKGPVIQAIASRMVQSGDTLDIAVLIAATFVKDQPASILPITPEEVFQALVKQGHNLHVLGSSGFHRLAKLARTPAFTLQFGDLDPALAAVRSVLGSPA